MVFATCFAIFRCKRRHSESHWERSLCASWLSLRPPPDEEAARERGQLLTDSFTNLLQPRYELQTSWGHGRGLRFIVHSLFISDMTLNQLFSERSASFYGAEPTRLLATGEANKNMINSWVANKTNNQIKELVDSVSPHTQLVLLNAVSFRGQCIVFACKVCWHV